MEPDLHAIEEIAQPYIHVITPGWTIASVRFLAQGAFNKVYTITARNQDTCPLKDYIFRVALPIYSHYKVESDVATTEFVRSSTNIPVPVIYAFDSSSANKLGFEWILMEKVNGRPLSKIWDALKYNTKVDLTKQVAGWADQLSRHRFNKICSLYMGGDNRNSDFYIEPPIHTRLYEGDRLSQQVNRGPFESLQAFYDAILDLTQRQPKHKMRAALKEKVSKHVCTDVEGEKVYHAIRMHMNRLELKDGLPQNSQSVEETTLAQADEDDHRDEWRWGIGKSHLGFLPDDLFFYRDLLPKRCPLPPVSEPLTTMLSHPDMSMDNIFVDDAGKLVTLIN